jgi:hypothetical protein
MSGSHGWIGALCEEASGLHRRRSPSQRTDGLRRRAGITCEATSGTGKEITTLWSMFRGMTPWPIASGLVAACPPRKNGNTPHWPVAQPTPTDLWTRWHGIPTTQTSPLIRWRKKSQTLGVCTTHWAMCGSGVKTSATQNRDQYFVAARGQGANISYRHRTGSKSEPGLRGGVGFRCLRDSL